MRIVLDVTSAARPNRTGMGRYSLELACALSRLLPETDRLVLTTKPFRGRDFSRLSEVRSSVGVEFRTLPPIRGDIFHTPGIVCRFGIGGLRVVTVPDTFTLDLPDLSSDSWVTRRNQKLRRAVAKADFIILFSRWVLCRFRQLFPEFPEARLRVIAPGCDHLPETMTGGIAGELRGKKGYVLSVGRLEKRKNHAALVSAFGKCAGTGDMNLVIAGPAGDSEVRRVVQETGLEGRVRMLGRVSDEDLVALYRGASAFALVSLYEGFGLPLLEAMANGVPCLVSRGSALEEVAGGAALLADPYSVPDIAVQLARLLADDGLRKRLGEQGRARSSEFTWRRCAQETLAVYREVLAQKGDWVTA